MNKTKVVSETRGTNVVKSLQVVYFSFLTFCLVIELKKMIFDFVILFIWMNDDVLFPASHVTCRSVRTFVLPPIDPPAE